MLLRNNHLVAPRTATIGRPHGSTKLLVSTYLGLATSLTQRPSTVIKAISTCNPTSSSSKCAAFLGGLPIWQTYLMLEHVTGSLPCRRGSFFALRHHRTKAYHGICKAHTNGLKDLAYVRLAMHVTNLMSRVRGKPDLNMKASSPVETSSSAAREVSAEWSIEY
jgi:hypothetical protein